MKSYYLARRPQWCPVGDTEKVLWSPDMKRLRYSKTFLDQRKNVFDLHILDDEPAPLDGGYVINTETSELSKVHILKPDNEPFITKDGDNIFKISNISHESVIASTYSKVGMLIDDDVVVNYARHYGLKYLDLALGVSIPCDTRPTAKNIGELEKWLENPDDQPPLVDFFMDWIFCTIHAKDVSKFVSSFYIMLMFMMKRDNTSYLSTKLRLRGDIVHEVKNNSRYKGMLNSNLDLDYMLTHIKV